MSIRFACSLCCRSTEETRCPVVYNNDTMELRIRYAQTADGGDTEAALRLHTSPAATCAHSPPFPYSQVTDQEVGETLVT